MKRKVVLLVLLLLMPLWVTFVSADMGPKPSTEITFKDLGEGTYYVSIFGTNTKYGPNGPLTGLIAGGSSRFTSLDEFKQYYSDYPAEVIDKFADYSDGTYYFWGNLNKVTAEDNKIEWTYYAPDDFLVVMVTPEGELITSDPYQRSVIAGYYKATIENGKIVLKDNYNYGKELLKFAGRVVATIIIELLIGLIFGYRDKDSIRTIVKTNIFTQVLLNVFVSLADILFGILGALFIMLRMEIVIFVIEGIIYGKKLTGHTWLAWTYSLIANAASFFLGTWLLTIMTVYM